MLTLVSPRPVHASCTSKFISVNREQPQQPTASSERPSFLLTLLRALGAMHS